MIFTGQGMCIKRVIANADGLLAFAIGWQLFFNNFKIIKMLKYFSWQFWNVVFYTILGTPFLFFWVSAIAIYRKDTTLEMIFIDPCIIFFPSIIITFIVFSLLCFVIRPINKYLLNIGTPTEWISRQSRSIDGDIPLSPSAGYILNTEGSCGYLLASRLIRLNLSINPLTFMVILNIRCLFIVLIDLDGIAGFPVVFFLSRAR